MRTNWNKAAITGVIVVVLSALALPHLGINLERKPTFEIGSLMTERNSSDSYLGSSHLSTFLFAVKAKHPLRDVQFSLPIKTVTKCKIEPVDTSLRIASCNATNDLIEATVTDAIGQYRIKAYTVEPLEVLPIEQFGVKWEQ